MARFALNPITVTVVLSIAFAGDFFRNAFTVPVWWMLAMAAGAWGVGVTLHHRRDLRRMPIIVMAMLGWWFLSPAWSPYAWSSLGLTLGALLTVTIGTGLALALTPAELFVRMTHSLRIILSGSLLFECVVALMGHPVYPVGMVVTPGTSIELAWSRAVLFHPGERIQGLVGNANILGMLALLLLVLGAAELFRTRRWFSFAALDGALAGLILALTASATVFVALIAAAMVVGFAALLHRRSRTRYVLSGGIALGIVGAVIAAALNWSTVMGILGKSPDLTHRFDIWTAVLSRISQSPWVGFGFVGWWPSWEPWFAIHSIRNIPVAQAHNVWIDVVLQTGLVGLVLWAGSLIWIGARLWKMHLREFTTVSVVPLALCAAQLVQSLTESRFLTEWGLVLLAVWSIYSSTAHRTAPVSP